MNLDPVQLLILGTIASVVVQGYKWLSAKLNKPELSRTVLTAVLIAVSLVLSYLWATPQLPNITESPLEFVQAILSVASSVVGSAIVIYNWLLKAVFEKVNTLMAWANGK